ncbi:hypothetical protein [Streptomyces sp. NPDC005231]|uniref:hypothetical protein n=1 Tax=Streptomyces sp. NPDC005231 TaxID=3157026 RepID=UPI0033AF350D
MTGANFEGDPARLRAFMLELDDVSAQARAIGKDMREGLRPNMDWCGEDDPYARSAGPQFRDTVETLSETLDALADAVANINNGRRLELAAITGATYDALERISQLQRKTDDVTNSPGGGKSH